MFWASGSVRRFQHTKRILQKRSLPLSRTSTHPSISVSETQGVMFIARSHAFRRLAFQTPTSITSSSHRWQRMQSSVAQQRNETPDAQVGDLLDYCIYDDVRVTDCFEFMICYADDGSGRNRTSGRPETAGSCQSAGQVYHRTARC